MLPKVSPPTPIRCYPVALGLKSLESVSNLEPMGQISCFISNRNQSSGESMIPRSMSNSVYCRETKVRGPPVRVLDLDSTSVGAGVHCRVSRVMPSMCNPVALDSNPKNWDPLVNFLL